MDYQMEQASIQAKALQILNTKELFISQVLYNSKTSLNFTLESNKKE